MSKLRRAARVRSQDLRDRRGGGEIADWAARGADDRPRLLGPREYIGTGVTRRGRFAQVDPLRTGKLWGRGEWIAFGIWLGTAGGSSWLAWRRLYRSDD